MTLYEFNLLDESTQETAAWAGCIIGDRVQGAYSILLFQIASFYVEVYYHSINKTLKRIKSFSSTEHLDPYLEKMDLSGKF